MISALKNRLSVGVTNAPTIPNGSPQGGQGVADQTDGRLHPDTSSTLDFRKRSPSRMRKRAIDQAPYQESVAARELRIFYNRNKLCNSFKKVLSSSAGLLIVLILYICLGAVLFQQFEGDNEEHSREMLRTARVNLSYDIDRCYNNTSTVDVHDCIVRKVTEWEGKYVLEFPVAYFNTNTSVVWTFENSFYFCFTTISTIGYGTITPRTPVGRISCTFYAIVGIPLMLLFIADVGTALARWAKICAIAIKQNRKRTHAFKEAAKASLRRHLKPQKNGCAPEADNTTELEKPPPPLAKSEDDVMHDETPSLSTVNENEDTDDRGEFWVKMHLPKHRSLSMTTQESQSFDNDDDLNSHSSEDDSDVSDDGSRTSTGSESRDDSIDTLKLVDNNNSVCVQIDPDEENEEGEDTKDEDDTEEKRLLLSENVDKEIQTHHVNLNEGSCTPSSPDDNEVLVNPVADMEPLDLRSSSSSHRHETTMNGKPPPLGIRRQSSRVDFGDVIDLQSGKRTSIQRQRSMSPGKVNESSAIGGDIIENPLAETDEENEVDKLLKPTGFRYNSSPRRNAVFIPGSDSSPSTPPASPDMGHGRKSQSSAPSRRRSSITRKMGMAFGSISAVSDRDVAHFSFPAWLALLLLIIYLLFGAGVISNLDDVNIIDSFYFSFISLSTIGFGDLTPVKSDKFAFLYTFLGLCFTSMCMSLSSKELTRLLKKLAWKVGYYKSRQWKGSVRAFVKDKKRRIHERSEHWRGSRRQKNRKRKRPSAHRTGEKPSSRSPNSPNDVEQGSNHVGTATVT